MATDQRGPRHLRPGHRAPPATPAACGTHTAGLGQPGGRAHPLGALRLSCRRVSVGRPDPGGELIAEKGERPGFAGSFAWPRMRRTLVVYVPAWHVLQVRGRPSEG